MSVAGKSGNATKDSVAGFGDSPGLFEFSPLLFLLALHNELNSVRLWDPTRGIQPHPLAVLPPLHDCHCSAVAWLAPGPPIPPFGAFPPLKPWLLPDGSFCHALGRLPL
jgi:hypothetical protein